MTPAQVSVCVDETDGAECSVSGVIGYCDLGVCLVIACGNGRTDPGEVCDDGNLISSDGCRYDCVSDETCGNGVVDAHMGEVCDDGNLVSGDGCAGDCLSSEICGNAVLDDQKGEVCDDGNSMSGDGCRGDCGSDETCGNGILDVHTGEQCDCGDGSGPLPLGCVEPNSDQAGAQCGTDCVCGGDCPEPMITVPAGNFQMGCNMAVDSDCQADESPYHEVMLDAYTIHATAVTQAEYEAYRTAVGGAAPTCDWDPSGKAEHPVACVTWNQAESYCTWTGNRLCTEAEWEKAARGVDGRKYPWGDEVASCAYAVMDDGAVVCGAGDSWPVGSKPAGASPYGALDMAGNMWAWVSDWSSASYEGPCASGVCTNPQGPAKGTYRIVRGGNFSDPAYHLRASNRGEGFPSTTYFYVGIRCCGSITP